VKLDKQETREHQDHVDVMVTVENQENKEPEEHQDLWEHLVPQDHLDDKENVEHLDLMDSEDQMAFQAVQENADSPENRAALERQVDLVPQEGKDQLADQD